MTGGYTVDTAGDLCSAPVVAFDLATVVSLWCAAGSIGWVAAHAISFLRARRLVRLDAIEAPEPERWPSLSVVVPARDEQDTIEDAARTLLAQDYPDLQIVLVDDRSTDRTPGLVDRLARQEARVTPIHVTSLPEGWLGKVHALHRGLRAARGEWVLFTDADVHFAPGVLRRAVAAATARELDHFAVAPEIRAPGVWLEATGAAFGGLFLLRTRAHDVERDGATSVVGIGAFNLVRRRALDRTEGLPWLRLEVLDDLGLALMLRNAGARTGFALGVGSLAIEWYPSLGAMARGLEKNLFGAAARYRVGRLVAGLAAGAALLAAPWLALLPGVPLPVRATAVLAAGAVIAHALYVRSRFGGRLLALSLAPVGAGILAAFLVRSAALCLARGGIEWRGTFHSLDELRRGQRVRL